MRGLHHVGITVRDLDASIRFYHDVLGLGFANEPTPWFEGRELACGVGPDGYPLELVEIAYTRPEERTKPITNYLAAR